MLKTSSIQGSAVPERNKVGEGEEGGKTERK